MDKVKRDYEQEITDSVIALLEKGTVPWRMPWSVAGLEPTSLQTGKVYQGSNYISLAIAMMCKEYKRNLWVTYKNAQALGGHVRKGEKGWPVMHYQPYDPELDDDGNQIKRGGAIRSFKIVFNVEQCDGLEIPAEYDTSLREPVAISDGVKRVLDGYDIKLTHKEQGRAFYSPLTDAITLPPLEAFSKESDYAETLFHELTHSTGHKSRLNRFKEDSTSFGCETYSKEELVAELGAGILAAKVGVTLDIENVAAYCQSWLKSLKNDKSLIFDAAAKAGKASSYILGEVKSDDAAEGEV